MGCWKLKKSFLLFTLFPVGPLSKGHISLLPFQSIHWPSALKCRTDVEGLRIFYRWNEPHWPKVHLKPPKGGVSRHTSREFIALLVDFVATALKYLKDANCRWSHKWGTLLFFLPKCVCMRGTAAVIWKLIGHPQNSTGSLLTSPADWNMFSLHQPRE